MSVEIGPPNVLLLLNDHQAYYRHGWDGGVRPQIPAFERVARSGMRFDTAYTPTALCVPARRSLWTGLYPHNHGLMTNNDNAPEKDGRCLFHPLSRHGYRQYYYGKWHNGHTHQFDHGCEGFSMAGYGHAYRAEAYRAYCEEHRIPPARAFLETTLEENEPIETELGLDELGMASKSVGRLTTPTESHEAFFLSRLACDRLKQLKTAPTPWFMVVSFWGPHRPFLPSSEFASQYKPQDIGRYRSLDIDLASRPESYRFEHNHGLCDEAHRLRQPNPFPWSRWQHDLARSYAHVTMVDQAAARILDALESCGLARNTVVIASADHGDAIASHGGHATKGPYMVEETYRIPLAIRWPGRVPPRARNTSLVSLLDLAPTILEMAGTGFDHAVDGRSLVPLLLGKTDRVRSALLCEFNGLNDRPGFRDYPARMVVKEGLKYVATQDSDIDELYDLRRDPYALHNLAGDPAHRATQLDMIEELQRQDSR